MLRTYTDINSALDFVRSHDLSGGITGNLLAQVETIRNEVASRGDDALIDFSKQFDGVTDSFFSLIVDEESIAKAYDGIPSELLTALKLAKDSITQYHTQQLPENWMDSPAEGVRYGVKWSAIDSAGLYVPGGRAIYPSTVLMNAIPAKLAGVESIVMVSPSQPDGNLPDSIVVAAHLCGVDVMVKSGGAQTVFALAHGTHLIPKVDKIVGPGNSYVTAAKQLVYGQVDIDKPAGPSEVLVYVDQLAYAPYAASELLAQLEHDPDAIAVCVSESADILRAVHDAFNQQFEQCQRQDIIRSSASHSVLLHTNHLDESIRALNLFASEHLVLLTDSFDEMMPSIKHGGSIFCGPYTPVALGDYCAGPNHVLPTGGAARFASPLGVLDFMKYSGVSEYSKSALSNIASVVDVLATTEGFDAHNRSIQIRLES